MSTGHLIEDNELAKQGKSFVSTRVFNAVGDEQNAQAQTLAEVRAQFPYPPASCEEALLAIQNIDEHIKGTQEKIAAGLTSRVGKRYLDAYMAVKTDFVTYANISKCVETALAGEDEKFAADFKKALDDENAATTKKKSTDNVLIFGTIGIVFVGAIVLILKNRKAA